MKNRNSATAFVYMSRVVLIHSPPCVTDRNLRCGRNDTFPFVVRHPLGLGDVRSVFEPFHCSERAGRRRRQNHLRRFQGSVLLAQAQHSRGKLVDCDRDHKREFRLCDTYLSKEHRCEGR